MISRGKRILSMLSQKDKERLGQLEFVTSTLPTQGVDLNNLDVDQIKEKCLGTPFANSLPSQLAINLDPVDLLPLENPLMDIKKVNHNDMVDNYKSITSENVLLTDLVYISPQNNALQTSSSGPDSSGSQFVLETDISSDSCESIDLKEILVRSANEPKSSKEIRQSTEGTEKSRKQFNIRGEVQTSSINITGKLKRDKREFCVYCQKAVTNFSRHLTRAHNTELEVMKLSSLRKGCPERKKILDEIRKEGNFVNSFGPHGVLNPVRRPKSHHLKKCTDYLPCYGCKGFFIKSYLHRHMKKCHKKEYVDSKNAQSGGLTLLTLSENDKNFEELNKKVFPHMQADEITKKVLDDYLIKCYGLRYFKCHREKHLVNTVSQRMRELGRFLIILQESPTKLNDLMEYLKPCYFDLLVEATNTISGYNFENDSFKSPSLALRWGTVLKQVCEAAMFLTVKNDRSTRYKEIKQLQKMIGTHFRFYVSTNANKDLASKKWQKGSMLPLTEDVIQMNSFVISEEAKYAQELQMNPNNKKILRKLTEALLVHVILLNRKRSGEAQRIKIEDYLRKDDETTIQDIFESLSSTEKALVKQIKRIAIRGKKSRCVPVIFTKSMQDNIEILLKSRNQVAISNPYLFANPYTENSFLWSYKVLKTVAVKCGIQNIDSITATSLRKHIATIAQIISMDDCDLEQLSVHLGHEKATHLNYYRKTDDKLQIAKISKLLLLMEKETLGVYRGKALAEIDLEIPDLDDNTLPMLHTVETDNKVASHSNDSEGCYMLNSEDENYNNQKHTGADIPEEPSSSHHKKEKRSLIPWTKEQKEYALSYFKFHLRTETPPKKHEVEDLKRLHPITFKNKTWAQIKIFIVNNYKKK